MKKKIVTFLLAAMGGCLLYSGCGKKEEEPKKPEPEVTADITTPDEDTKVETESDEETKAEPEEDQHEGEAPSLLTGEWVDEELAGRRPVSCMIGNTESALPQYGIGSAEIIYEAPVEGGLTRLMGIFGDYEKLEKLGSVRSSRLYYAYESMAYDAIYLHYGQASYAEGFLKSGQIDDLNGLDYNVDKAVIYRDTSLKAPHNAYATGQGLAAGIELKQYRTTYEKDYKGTYQFAKDGKKVKLNGDSCEDAGVVQPGYQSNHPYFEYNPEDGLYYRYQYGSSQVDGNDGKQLSVKNVLLQSAPVHVLDDKGYLEVGTTGEGSGWYVTNGKAEPVTWKRADNFSPVHYYDGTGKEITLNQGKTWICVVDNSRLDQVHFYKDSTQMQ